MFPLHRQQKKVICFFSLGIVLLFIVFLSVTTKTNLHRRSTRAIEAVLHENARAFGYTTLDNTLEGIMVVVGRRWSINTSSCPDDFSAAFKRNILAGEEMLDQLLSEPRVSMMNIFVPPQIQLTLALWMSSFRIQPRIPFFKRGFKL